MQLSPVLNILGLLATILAAAMLIPMCVDLYLGSSDWHIFALSALLTGFVGVSIWLATSRREALDLGLRQAFLLTNGSWVMIGIFGSLPFMFSELHLSFTDSVFESISGITTTGSTVLVEIEKASPGILIWRALLQWLGGVGIVVMAMAVLPMLSVGGMQLFRTESYERAEKVVPRATQLAGGIGLVYTALTALWAMMLTCSGMDIFDAIAHSLSTVAGGGFSTHDKSIGFFDSGLIEAVCIIFMLLSAASFAVHYAAIFGGKPLRYFYDSEFRFFLTVVMSIILITLIFHTISNSYADVLLTLRASIFHTVSIVTTSGFTTENFSLWPSFLPYLLLVGAFMGACSQSVGGGIKTWRVLIMLNQAYKEILSIIHPNAVLSTKIGNKVIDSKIAEKVWGFFSIYVFIFMFLLMAMLGTGLNFESAFSAIGACLNNLGPGLGDVASNYKSVSEVGKIILCLAMILGRLEIFTLLVLFTPAFWRR